MKSKFPSLKVRPPQLSSQLSFFLIIEQKLVSHKCIFNLFAKISKMRSVQVGFQVILFIRLIGKKNISRGRGDYVPVFLHPFPPGLEEGRIN